MNKLKQLFGIVFLFVALLLALLFGAFYLQSSASEELSRANESRYRSYLLADELRQSSDDLTRLARTYVVSGDSKWEEQYFEVLDIRNGKKERPLEYQRIYWDFAAVGTRPRAGNRKVPLLDLMREAGFTQEELGKLAEAERNSNGLVRVETVAMNMVKGLYEDSIGGFTVRAEPDHAKARELMHDAAYHNHKAQIMKPLDAFFVLLDQRTLEVVRAAEDRRSLYQKAVIGLSVLLMLVLLLALVLAYRQMRGRLVAQQAAEVGEKKAHEENERLNNSVVTLLQTVYQLGNRDLTVRADVTQDVIGTVASSINQMTAETSQTLSDVRDIANQVHQISQSVRSQTSVVEDTVRAERESLERMRDSLQQATASLTQVSTLSANSNDAAEKASEATQQALLAVDGTVKGMDGLRDTISEMEKRFKRLGERSQEISTAIGLINSISERTHVLALNASMQAATAGEAGRGFAVVAEEVQRLSDSSRQATGQIAVLVNNIQAETSETLFTVNRLISDVVKQSELAQRAGLEMNQTRRTTTQLVELVKQIAGFSNNQAKLAAVLQRDIHDLNKGTEQTTRVVAHQSESTETLAEQARRLTEAVGQFRLTQAAA